MATKGKITPPTIESDYEKSEILEIRNKLVSALKQFEFLKEKYIKKGAQHRKTETAVLQTDIYEYLEKTMTDFEWEQEYVNPNTNRKDRIDIYGKSNQNNVKIVIELDGWRPTQISKKFLSRQALFIQENLIYVSLSYPCTEKNPNECLKYFEYCKVLSETMSKNTNVAKLYVGHILQYNACK